jgi:GTPase SAR1 family protein
MASSSDDSQYSSDIFDEGDVEEFSFKIIVVGDVNTGKSSIIRKFIHNTFGGHYTPTIGVDLAVKSLKRSLLNASYFTSYNT